MAQSNKATKHTWVVREGIVDDAIIDNNDIVVAMSSRKHAELIASAPRLKADNEMLLFALDALVSIRDEMRLGENIPVGRVLYIDRLFREATEAINKVTGSN